MKSKTELQKEAQKYFEQYGKKVIFATADGQFFLEKNRAELYAKSKSFAVYELKYNEQASEVAEEKDAKVVELKPAPNSPEMRNETSEIAEGQTNEANEAAKPAETANAKTSKKK